MLFISNVETSQSSVPGAIMTHDTIQSGSPTSRQTDLHTGHQSAIIARMPSQKAIQSIAGTSLTRKAIERQGQRRRTRSNRSVWQSNSNDQVDMSVHSVDENHDYHENQAELIRQYASNMKRKRDEYQ